MPPVANQAILSGAIVAAAFVGAAAIAISQIPEVRQFGEDCRRKIAVALHNLGDEINPNRSQPRFNRPEDAEGFMQPNAASGEMDADDESRKRQREELMYWNAIKLQKLQKDKEKEESRGPTFDDILRNDSSPFDDHTYATKTGAEIQGEEGTLRRRRESSRGMGRSFLYSNPFADENCVDSEGDAKMIGPEADEMEDIYTDNDLKDVQKLTPDNRVLAAASDYPLGQHYTTQLENSIFEGESEKPAYEHTPVASEEAASASMHHNTSEDYSAPLMALEGSNKRKLEMAREQQDEMRAQLRALEMANKRRLDMARQQQDEKRMEAASASEGTAIVDYELQLRALEMANKRRFEMARQQQYDESMQAAAASEYPSVLPSATLVDVSETLDFPAFHSTHTATPYIDGNSQEAQEPNDAFASIHAWNDSSNASFYSPLPGTPRALSSAAASEPEHVGGDITPTDSISLAGSGEDVANDNASSVGGGRYDDVMSLDGGISTPGSWTEVGSVVSEDDFANHR